MTKIEYKLIAILNNFFRDIYLKSDIQGHIIDIGKRDEK
jgi:hypothetical protein